MASFFPPTQVAFLTYLSCLLFLPALSSADSDDSISVIVSSHSKPFIQALDGFRDNFPQAISVSYVDANPELVKHKITTEKSDFFVAIGPAASKIVWENTSSHTPKITLMVLDPYELLGRQNSLCGTHLRVPGSEQLLLIKKHLGSGRKVGILYNPKENKDWISSAMESAANADLLLTPLPVFKSKDVAKKLTSAVESIDTLLFIPDSTVISETMVIYLTKKALLKGIAVVGYNHFFVETGAVMSISIDYNKVGVIGAKIAIDILSGRSCNLSTPPFSVEWNKKSWDFINKGREIK